MRQFSAALLSRALGPLIAFLSAPCGRHSSMAGRRRRRSTRVRRYVPEPLPAPAPAQIPVPRLAPPSEVLPAEEVSLVRPYFAAHERLRASASPVPAPRSPDLSCETDEVRRAFALVQERAAALLQQWRNDPRGDLLGEPAPRFGVVRPSRSAKPTTPTRYAEWGELASLIRTWDERRQGVPA